jgi:hypothetical protein
MAIVEPSGPVQLQMVQPQEPAEQEGNVKLPDKVPSVHLRVSLEQVLPQETVAVW